MNALLALWLGRKTEEGASALRKFIRKWFGYALIALLLIVSSLALTNYVRVLKQANAIAKFDLSTQQYKTAIEQLQKVNAEQDEKIKRITAIRDLDGQVLTGLQTDLDRLRSRDGALNEKLTKLEKSNAEVRALLSTRTDGVPGGGCVLDNSCADGSGDAAEKPASEVPKASGGSRPGSAGLYYEFKRAPVCFR